MPIGLRNKQIVYLVETRNITYAYAADQIVQAIRPES